MLATPDQTNTREAKVVKAIRIHEFGGPEVMRWEDVELGRPGPGQALVRQHAVGLNFIDVYHRTGLYPNPLPFTPGSEGAGEVIAVGDGVTDVRPGDRVAYGTAIGAYAAERLVAADKLVVLPDDIADETAASMMLKGLTAEYLLRGSFRVEPGHIVLVHAAAGGVGQILCQWAKAIGAIVIGTVGTPDKGELAKAHGADHVIFYQTENFVERVAEITSGTKCHVVYDGVGQATFPASLDCLRPHGTFVSFGSASGPIKALDLSLLASKGSLFATRPTLGSFAGKRADLLAMTDRLMGMMRAGKVTIAVAHRFALQDAAEAHRALESRQTSGATVLLP